MNLEKFWSRVDQSGGDEACWPWLGARITSGYGNFGGSCDEKRWMIYCHRFVYEITRREPIPYGLFVCHSCDNPPCCNPKHLFLGTIADNNRDCHRKGRYSRGEHRWKAILTSHPVSDILDRLWLGESIRSLATKYGVDYETISYIKLNKNWKHIEHPRRLDIARNLTERGPRPRRQA